MKKIFNEENIIFNDMINGGEKFTDSSLLYAFDLNAIVANLNYLKEHKYQKPAEGIPVADLVKSVQESLKNGDTAYDLVNVKVKEISGTGYTCFGVKIGNLVFNWGYVQPTYSATVRTIRFTEPFSRTDSYGFYAINRNSTNTTTVVGIKSPNVISASSIGLLFPHNGGGNGWCREHEYHSFFAVGH